LIRKIDMPLSESHRDKLLDENTRIRLIRAETPGEAILANRPFHIEMPQQAVLQRIQIMPGNSLCDRVGRINACEPVARKPRPID